MAPMRPTRCATRRTAGSRASPARAGMVLFGVTGDLSRKKVMPAIYDLANRGLLPPGFSLVGFARRDWADQDFAQIVHDAVKEHARTPFREEVWRQLVRGLPLRAGRLRRRRRLRQPAPHRSRSSTRLRGTGGNMAFYLAIPPAFFGTVVGQLKEHGLAEPVDARTTWRRVVVEKPFGHDLESARELNDVLAGVFPPGSIFRIDHYLGKETVQNILAMRFANNMFEPIWNANYVDHVQITMAEDIGIGGRAGYYDGIGAARDVIQNHLLQLMALVAMEEPIAFDAESLRIEKQKVLASVVLPPRLDLTTARGQYAAGWAGRREGDRLPRGGGHPEDLHDRDVRRDHPPRRHPPLGGRAVLPAHRQAARAAGSPRWRSSSSGRRTCRSAPPRPRSSPRTRW